MPSGSSVRRRAFIGGEKLFRDAELLANPSRTAKTLLLETMKNPVESLLEDDHVSLGQLLTELDAELSKPNFASAFELLDLFWARLAIHIRAENLHLFPALANALAPRFAGKGGLPTPEEVQNVLARLRSDHDFFMKELALTIRTMRGIAGSQETHLEEVENLRQRLATIAKRLELHNRLEEKQAYTWPALLFDEQEIAALRARIAHELENIPPRFAKNPEVNFDR